MKFKVGDKVYATYSSGVKKGKVIEILLDDTILLYDTLCVLVLFEDGHRDTFTQCGRWLSSSMYPTLFKIKIKDKIDKLLEL